MSSRSIRAVTTSHLGRPELSTMSRDICLRCPDTQHNGDGGNRTHVRDRVRMASTSVAGALISSPARLAGGVAGDQSP